jgi:hypothetical protein
MEPASGLGLSGAAGVFVEFANFIVLAGTACELTPSKSRVKAPAAGKGWVHHAPHAEDHRVMKDKVAATGLSGAFLMGALRVTPHGAHAVPGLT